MKNNQQLVSDPELQISVSGDTISHPSLGYASTGICEIVSPSTEICHSGIDTVMLAGLHNCYNRDGSKLKSQL